MPRSSSKPYRVGRSKTGLGLFATEPLRRGDFIARYTGKKIPNSVADTLYNKYLFEVNSRWTINGVSRRNTARYINHSCKPNAEAHISRGKVFIHALKRIEPGDEITYNYGKSYFEAFIEPYGCRCEPCRSGHRKRAAKRARNGRN